MVYKKTVGEINMDFNIKKYVSRFSIAIHVYCSIRKALFTTDPGIMQR